jgi:hypothetical protein
MLERIPYAGQLPASFFELPKRLYAGLPFAPGEDEAAVRQLFQQEAAQYKIVIYTDHQHLRLVGLFPHAGEVAYFGFWETTDDLALNTEAFAVLAADADWLGKTRIVGPLHFNTFQRYRLRLDPAPSWQQFDREPVNPPYYPQLLADLGYAPSLHFESRRVRAEAVPLAYHQKQAALHEVSRIPFDFIALTPATWPLLADELYQLVHEVFSQNPAYKAVPRAQFDALYNPAFAARLCPHSSVLFRDQASGRLAALSLCQPNYHGLSLPRGSTPEFGRDYPRLLRKTLLVKTVGVHPDFRQRGLQDLLAAYAMRSFQQYYEEAIFCLMRADNYSLRFTKDLPVETAHYALFEQTVARA